MRTRPDMDLEVDPGIDAVDAAEAAAQQARAQADHLQAQAEAARARQSAAQRAAANAADRAELARYDPAQRAQEWAQAHGEMAAKLTHAAWVQRQRVAHAQDAEWHRLRVNAERLSLPTPPQPPGSALSILTLPASQALDAAALEVVLKNRQTQGG